MTQQMNGPAEGQKYIDTIDPEDPEYIRQMRRPAEVKEDMKQMEQRRRVSLILNSAAFREELEQIVAEQIRAGPTSSLLALQQISELILPQSHYAPSQLFSKSGGTIIPIADIRGVDSLNYSKGEKLLRCKLAATYRLVDMFSWTQGIEAHITARISQDYEHFLVNPYGLGYHEISAACLAKVDMQGEVLDTGSTTKEVNKTSFSLHSAIHAARPDLKALLHLRNSTAVSVSTMNCGLLPLCEEAIVLGKSCTYEYSGKVEDQEERDRIARCLGPINKVLFLRNYGVVVGGETLEEAFLNAYNVMTACDVQIRAIPVGIDNLHMPSEEQQQKITDFANQEIVRGEGDNKRKWRKGELEFEALMRHLDNSGFRTGYIYRESLQRQEPRRERVNADVEYPPASTSFHAMFNEDPKSPVRAHLLDKQKKQFKSEWLATPNIYKKEEIEETGTPTPKKFTKWHPVEGEERPSHVFTMVETPHQFSPAGTDPKELKQHVRKWVQDGGSVGQTPVKLEDPNQFAPQGQNPKEFRQKQREIRQDYYTEKVSAGPQSRILEGITWEEAQRIKDGHVSGTSDSVIVVGAASKGIIQRDHQHNAVVYKTYYAPNPFDNMTEAEIEKYKKEIEGGKEPEEIIEPGPDGKLISTQERMEVVRQHQGEPQSPARGQVQQQVYPRRQYLETSLDDLTETTQYYLDPPDSARQPVTETSIDDDDVLDSPAVASSPDRASTLPLQSSNDFETPPSHFSRTMSARYAQQNSDLVQELHQSFDRSKSERKPKKKRANGEEGAAVPAGSPAKSSSSGDGTLDERSSREGSPTKEVAPEPESPSKEKQKKKKKFRMPSFSKKKDKKEKEAK